MKPYRIHQRRSALPALALLPALIQFSFAATIPTDPEGNVTVSPGQFPEESTIIADGGTSPSPLVLIRPGAILTGDVAFRVGAEVSAPNYTVDNSGFLSGADDGIVVEAAAAPTITIINRDNGVIQGGNEANPFDTAAIFFEGNGGDVDNFGIIRGLNGANGISGLDFLTVTNSGQISGRAGILADSDLSVTNLSGGTISNDPASTVAAIEALDRAFIDNFGTIFSSGADGIFVGEDALIFNAGRIEGAIDGINSLDLLGVVNEQGGLIIGNAGFGVNGGNDSEIFNLPGATIRGNLGGINLQEFGFVENDGSIFGGAGPGISLGLNGEVFNTGLIDGAAGIVSVNGSLITNSGTIRTNLFGGNAFSGEVGDDELVLNSGSLILGNVLGGDGFNTITFNGGQTSPTAPGNVIRGNVSDFATITKNGGGLALIGAVADVGRGLSITADQIDINSGALYFNADITGATVDRTTINARGAAVGGTGVWNANLNVIAGGFSAGAIPINLDVNPENSVGAVALTGNVIHSPGSFIRQDIVPDTQIIDGINSDIIEQIGAGLTYNISGANLRVSSTDVNRLITPGTYIIIDSDTQIVGFPSFGTVGVQFNPNTPDTGFIAQPLQGGEFPSNFQNSVLTTRFLTLGLEDGGTNLVMNINYGFGNLPGLSGNAAAFGGALDAQASLAGTGNLDIDQQDFIAALAFSDISVVQDTLTSLTPDGQFGLVAAVINSNYRLHRIAENHLAQARSGGRLIQEALPPVESKGGKGGMMSGGTTSRMVGNRGHVWGSFSYDQQDYDSVSPAAEFNGDTGAFTAGIDYRVRPNLLLGVMLDGSKSEFDFQGGDADIDSFRIAAYGTWGESLGLYSDFLIGYGKHDLDQSRRLGGLASGSRSSSSTDADSFQALLTFGYAMGSERIKHGPFAGVEYQRVDVDGFDHGGFLPGRVDGYDVDSFRGLVGYRVNANLGRFQPYASVAYAHEFRDRSNNTSVTLAGGNSFRIAGEELNSAVLIGAGTGITLTDSLSLDIGYRGEISTDNTGLDSHGGTLGLRYAF